MKAKRNNPRHNGKLGGTIGAVSGLGGIEEKKWADALPPDGEVGPQV